MNFASPSKNGEVRVFNTAGILNRVIDRNGNITRYSYIDANADGVADELASITDPFNRVTTYAYSGRFLASVKDPFNRETVFTIQNNRLTRITGPDPDGSGPRVAPYYDFAYTWNSTGQSILQTDAENEQHRYTFNRFGRVTRIDLPDGTNWRYQYLKDKGSIIRLPGQSSGVAVTPGEMEAIVTNPRGFQTKYQTDRFGLPTKIDYPDGSSEAYKRNRHGQPEEHVYPSANGGNSTAIYSYDAAQNLIQRTSPEGGTQTWEYESNFSLPIRYAQTGRPITVFFRDSRGNVTQVQTLAMQTAVGTANNVANRGLITALYSNPIDRFDVNNDGLVAESDATTMIAIVNAGSTPTYEETPDGRPVYPDVDGDGRLSPLDVLSVLNRLDAPQTRSESFTYSNGLDGMPSGMLLSSTDANNETTLYEYFPMNTAERGFLRRVLRSDGVFITPVAAYTYNSEGNVVSSADLYGRVTQYTVDRLDQVTEVRDVAPDGQDANRPKTKYAYSVMGHLNSITDPGDRTISIGRNRVERRLTLTRLGGTSSRTTTQIFDPMGNLISIVDPIDRLTTYEYDSMDRLVKTKLPAVSDSITTLELNYNKAGMVTSEKDALGTTTTYAYSSAGDLLRVSRPNPNSPGTTIDQVFGYSSPGILSSATDPLGNVTNYVVDNFGQLAKILRPKITTNEGRATETIAYDNAGRRRATSEATGQYQLVNVDLFGRLTSVESMDPDRSGPGIRPVTTFATPVMVSNTIAQNITIPTGQTLKITTDLRGRQTSYEIPRLNGAAGTLVATTQYDSLDRVVSQTSISGATSSFTYDEYDQLLQVNPPNPATGAADPIAAWKATYDQAGRVRAITAPNGGVTNYDYDNWDRITFLGQPDPDGIGPLARASSTWNYNLSTRTIVKTDSDGNIESSVLDSLGRVTSQTGGDGGVTRFVYNAGSQLEQLIDPVNNVTKWAYNAAGEVTREEQVGIGARVFGYTVDGLRNSYVDRTGAATRWNYNLGGNPTRETWLDSSGGAIKTINYEYDSLARPTLISASNTDRVS